MTDEQRRIFAAAADRVLPGVHLVGAGTAGVEGYLERLWEHPRFRSAEPSFVRGLALLDELARSLHGKGFSELSTRQQDGVLRQVEAIPHATARRFLISLVRVVLAGYFGHPIHGGNQGGVAWRQLGLWFPRRPDEVPDTGAHGEPG